MAAIQVLRKKYGRRVQLYGNTLIGFSEGAYAAMNVGVKGSAAVVSLVDTGSKLADTPVYDVTMDVVADGQPGFRAVHRQVIAAAALGNWPPGKVVPVRFDPNDARHQLTIG